MSTTDLPPVPAPASRRRPGTARRARAGRRLCLALWRHRGLVTACCLGAAVLLGLTVLAPPPRPGARVLVTTYRVQAGAVIDEAAVETVLLPVEALPANGLADTSVVGQRAAITLEKGTVLTTSMTTGAATSALDGDERLVEVPVGAGGELAQPGAKVDIVATPATAYAQGQDQSQVIAFGARVITTRQKDDTWGPGGNVTLITLAVPRHTASLVVGAASTSSLSVMLSP